MRKKIFGRNFSRARKGRTALYRSLTRALVERGEIKTTLAKAKTIAGFVEKQVLICKRNSIAARRQVLSNLGNDKATTNKLFLLSQEMKRATGFTRVVRLTARRGDAAEMARLEFVDKITLPSKEEKLKDKKAVKEPKALKKKEVKSKIEKKNTKKK